MQQLCQRSLSNLNRICPWPRTVSHWPSLLLQSKVPRPIPFKLKVPEAQIKGVLDGLCCPLGNCLKGHEARPPALNSNFTILYTIHCRPKNLYPIPDGLTDWLTDKFIE